VLKMFAWFRGRFLDGTEPARDLYMRGTLVPRIRVSDFTEAELRTILLGSSATNCGLSRFAERAFSLFEPHPLAPRPIELPWPVCHCPFAQMKEPAP
jgi:hypothetical protein